VRRRRTEGLLLGWSESRAPVRVGFAAPVIVSPRKPSPVFFNQEGHLITVAPTGAGKGVSCIMPALLTYSGPVICIDPKGEAYHVTAEWRRTIGQRVIRLALSS